MKQRSFIPLMVFLFITIVNCHKIGAETTLFDFNDLGAGGTSLPGWTWYSGVGGNGADDYGSPGWRKDNGQFYSGNTNWMPRMHEKRDYGNDTSATIDTSEIAPRTPSGGSLKVYDTGNSSTYQACWWYLFGDRFGSLGFADSSTDRLSFYFKVEGLDDPQTETNSIWGHNIHFGTYLCWPGGSISGEDCPKEADNQHYYHYLTIRDDTWLHVLLERHPIHQRGVSQPPDDNPAAPYNYYEYMNNLYLEIRYPMNTPTTYWIDEMKLYTTSQPENDISITSVWVGYWSGTDKWEIGFMDPTWWPLGNNTQSTFEIRWSTAPITNSNYESATIIEPEYHEFGTTNQIRRPNTWKWVAWTRFEIPDNVEAGATKIYFAIKDVSSLANGDGHDAPSSLIHTIDYNLLKPPSAPTNLRIKK